jgi:hypothetical protein
MGVFEQQRGGGWRLRHFEHSITQGFSCVPNDAFVINQHRTQRYFYIRHDLEPASLTTEVTHYESCCSEHATRVHTWKRYDAHATTRFNLVLTNLFNQPIPGFILLLEPHHKPVKDETGTNRGQNESCRGREDRLSWAHLETISKSNDACQTPIFITA